MYIVPQVLVFQELETVPAAAIAPLNACIIGPNYGLIRYDQSDEKAQGSLGAYVPDTETSYSWPNRPAGGIVDQDWTKVFADNAYLKYWSNPSTINVPASGDSNRIESAAGLYFKSYSTYDRDTSLKNRDVQVGDGVKIVGGGEEILTKVTGFEHATVASDVDTATADDDNQANETAAVSSSQTSGDENEVIISAEDGSSYDGLEDAVLSETYTVEVITGGAPSSARLKVTSASGKDNQASVTPAAFASPTAIGTRGLTVTFNNTGSGTDTPLDEFIVGQTWEVTVAQDYTVPTPTEGGTYTGPSDASYIITVSKGGDLNEAVEADQPTITVTTTTGIDYSGPHPIDNSAAVTIGNYGVTIAFTGDSLVTGDRFIIPVTAAKDGGIDTLVLANALPAALQGTSVSVDLYIIKNVEIPEFVIGGIGTKNFTQSATEITLADGIQLTDASWYDDAGEEILMDLYSADLYVQYRSLLQDYTGHTRIFTTSELSDQITPDNPFMYGLFKALSNSGGTPVRGIAVATNDAAGYAAALDDLTGRDDVYSVVPLTQDRTIQNLVAAHVEEMSSPENGRWRIGWLNSAAVEELGIYTEDSSGDPVLITVVDDGDTSGTQYTKLQIDGGMLITNAVQSGDILRTNYSVDSEGESTYEEYTIDRIISEDVAMLVSGPSAAINVESKGEIWRNLDKDEIAEEYAQVSGSFGSRRIRHIWPDYTESAGIQVEGFYVCCALAGLRSGSAAHQGLTNVEVQGFDNMNRTTEFFSKPQLDTLAEAGTWIVTQDFETGQIYTRHQLTTGDYNDLNQREDSITTNLDSISYYALEQFKPFIGKTNVTPEFLGDLEVTLGDTLRTFMTANTATLGPQLIAFDIVELRQHEILRDRIVATVNLTIPYPFNNLDLHLVI